ncbi:MAG: LOG family protein [Gammaproteobacteria bacterium]|nr:LOG family protein [Gammaproteobacteria bacterium]
MREHQKEYIDRSGSDTARGVRIMAEYLNAMEAFIPLKQQPLVTVFGSARLDNSTDSGRLATALAKECVRHGFGVVTGGSSGIMLCTNQGAYAEAKRRGLAVEKFSVGCSITLPFEEGHNDFIGTNTEFHYFFIRKFFLVAYSKAFFYLEGGGGTRDELWEVFCLIQTGKMPIHPLVAVGDDEVWKTVRADLDHMIARGTVSEPDRQILQFARTAEEAVDIVERFYRNLNEIVYDKKRHVIELDLKQPLKKATFKELKSRSAGLISGLRWDKKNDLLLIKQRHFRDYTTLYALIEIVNEISAMELQSKTLPQFSLSAFATLG